MLWIIIGSAIVVMGAGASLWATCDSRRDIANGHPRFESVADVTGIWNRDTLDGMLGARDAANRYQVNSAQIRAIRRPAGKLLLDSAVSDIVCICAALVAPFVYKFDATPAFLLLGVTVIFLMLGYAWGVYVVGPNRACIDEE